MARHVGKTTLAARVNIPFCIAVVLLCLTLISMHLTSGLFARYSTSVTDDDSARVAKFEVTTGDEVFVDTFLFEVAPNISVDYISPLITNNSEVAVKCTATAVNKTGNIPSLVSTPGEAVTIAPDESGTCTMKIIWNVENDDLESASDYAGMVDLIEVTIRVEQVD